MVRDGLRVGASVAQRISYCLQRQTVPPDGITQFVAPVPVFTLWAS
jgi:hypothetical protein